MAADAAVTERNKKMSAQTLNKKKSGFTLIELLVVVAIIAVIGAGVAVTYNRLDERAKTAAEINDIGTLTDTIKHWSFLHSWALPDGMDSLIDTDGNLYSQMAAQGGMTGVGSINSYSRGLYAQSGYTFVAETAPERVISSLAAGGITHVYLHDASRSPANDSTFTTGRMGSDVDTSSTAATLAATDNQDAKLRAQAIVDQNDAAALALTTPDGYDSSDPSTYGSYTGSYTLTYTDGSGSQQSETFDSLSAWTAAYTAAQTTANASRTVNQLAFVYPGGGAHMAGMQMAMNMTSEIISNCGLQENQVALPSEDATTAAQNGRSCWLVVFGLGRFSTVYQGNGARIDTPVTGKRYTEDSMYSRYLVVVKVPVDGFDRMTNPNGLLPQVACVLSPQGLSKAALDDTYRNDVKATSN